MSDNKLSQLLGRLPIRDKPDLGIDGRLKRIVNASETLQLARPCFLVESFGVS